MIGVRGAIIPSFGLQIYGKAGGEEGSSAAPGGEEGPGASQGGLPALLEFGKFRFEDGGFCYEDIGARTEIVECLDEECAKQAFGPVTLDGFAYFFPRDEGDAVVVGPAKKENEPGGMPDLVRPLVDAIELPLDGKTAKAA